MLVCLFILIVIYAISAILTFLAEQASRLMLWSGLLGCRLMGFAQPTAEFTGKLIVAFLAHRFQINLIKLGLLIHLLVTNRASKVVNTPGFVESGKH